MPGCAPPASRALPPGAAAAARAGEYRLVLVADSGARAGAATAGRLTLRARPDTAWRQLRDFAVRLPLWGATDVDVARVGARASARAASADPEAPGVQLLERRPGGAGARAARPVESILAIEYAGRGTDGPHMVLEILELHPGGFRGRWRSGGSPWTDAGRAAGYFCAARAAP